VRWSDPPTYLMRRANMRSARAIVNALAAMTMSRLTQTVVSPVWSANSGRSPKS